MAQSNSAATLYILNKLQESGHLIGKDSFDAIKTEYPFISKEGFEVCDFYLRKANLRYYFHLQEYFRELSILQQNLPSIRSELQAKPQSTQLPIPKTISSTDSEERNENENLICGLANGVIPSSASPEVDHSTSALLRIHVVDEAKRRSQDFYCPKSLLVNRMKFFAAHLTDDSKPDDVDISVQCDVVIFDWLMKYVHRDLKPDTVLPPLEPSNVISILISSDFLQMEDLVSECISYIRSNAESVVSNSPANFNCISDIVLKRLAALFDIEELDAIKDKKDRLKSKLYQAKIEAMFTKRSSQSLLGASSIHKEHLNQLITGGIDIPDATTLFQCKVCLKLLTSSTHSLLPCEASQLQLTRDGEITATHVATDSFDVNSYISGLYKETRSWRTVFWRLWATMQFLRCVRCKQWFRCIDFSSCWNHPEKPTVDIYPCCRTSYKPFEPFSVKTGGCKMMDHLTDFQIGGEKTKRIYELMLRFREPIIGEMQPSENKGQSCEGLALDPVMFIRSLVSKNSEERVKSSPTAQTSNPSSYDFSRFLVSSWNVDLSTRLNQDHQRQADYRIMRDICEFIVVKKSAQASSSLSTTQQQSIFSQNLPLVPASTASSSLPRDVPGGLYARIENLLRNKLHSLLAPSSRGGTRTSQRQRPSSLLK